MKDWKKMMGMLLVGSIVLGTVGCGSAEPAAGSDSAGDASVSGKSTEDAAPSDSGAAGAGASSADVSDTVGDLDDPDEIVVAFAGTGVVPKDVQMVEDAINELIRDKINVQIDLQCFTIGDFSQQINLTLTSGEQVDLLSTTPVGSSQFATMSSQHQFMPLNELLDEFGQGIVATVGEEWLESTTSEGNIYGVPSYSNKAQDTFFCIRTDLVEKHNLQDKVQNIQSVDDIGEILEVLSTDDSIVAPIGGKQQIFTGTFGVLYDTVDNVLAYDTLGAAALRVAGVEVDKDAQKIVNLYESEEYAKQLALLKEWYDKGYIYKDTSTYAESGPDLIKNNVTGCCFSDSQLGVETSMRLATGYDMTCVKVIEGMVDANSMRKFVWGIPTVAREPEAAMRFLNLMYTDEELVNLLTWGIEGVHYEEKEDGTIGFLEGMTSESCGYYLGGLDFLFGNCYLAKVWEGNDPKLREKAKLEMDNHKMSPIVGFALDTSALENEITALTNAVSEYRYSLECGMFDPVTELPVFLEKLEACGVQTYIDEAQRQLDAYLAEAN